MLRRLAAVAAALVATALLPAAQATAGTDPDPMAGAPEMGECNDISLRQAAGETLWQQPVECSGRHTLVTFVVAELPDSLDWDSPTDEVHDAVLDVCAPARDETLGRNPATQYLSLYGYFWFKPTKPEIAHGARWFSCHLALVSPRHLFPLEQEPSRLTKRGMDDSVARCSTHNGAFVPCSERHASRAVFASVIDQKLTEKRVKSAALATCPRHVSTRTWFYSARPLARGFVLACYSKTTR